MKESFELAAKLCFGDVLGCLKELSFWVYGKKAMDVSRRYDELLEKVLKEHEEKRLSGGDGNESERDLVDIMLDVHHDAQAEFKITRTHIKAFLMVIFTYHILPLRKNIHCYKSIHSLTLHIYTCDCPWA